MQSDSYTGVPTTVRQIKQFSSKMIQVNNRIVLEEDGFGDINKEVIMFLLNSVCEFFAKIGVESKKNVFVKHFDIEPRCCLSDNENTHNILLTVVGNDWNCWTYEFAHEYCHHLIDGGLQMGTRGLRWFEEAVCHVSSYICLDNLERLFVRIPSLMGNVASSISYLQHYLTEDDDVHPYENYMPTEDCPEHFEIIPAKCFIPLQSFIKSRIETLSKVYSPVEYEKIARALFPHFYNNQYLWRILPRIGDTLNQNSLSALLKRLLDKANDDYRESLEMMISCLLYDYE